MVYVNECAVILFKCAAREARLFELYSIAHKVGKNPGFFAIMRSKPEKPGF
jgi:hypothetical protein